MAKKCPNCMSEISAYQEFCYNCGQEIKHVAKRPKRENAILWGYFLLGFIIPFSGYAWYFFFSRNSYDKARSAFIGSIISSGIYFIGYQIMWYLGVFNPQSTETGAMLVKIVRLLMNIF